MPPSPKMRGLGDFGFIDVRRAQSFVHHGMTDVHFAFREPKPRQFPWQPSDHILIRVPLLGLVASQENLEPKKRGKGAPLSYPASRRVNPTSKSNDRHSHLADTEAKKRGQFRGWRVPALSRFGART